MKTAIFQNKIYWGKEDGVGLHFADLFSVQ